MDTLLSLDSHYMLFDEAEKEFDIDLFLAPQLLKNDEEYTVFGSPMSSPPSHLQKVPSVISPDASEPQAQQKTYQSSDEQRCSSPKHEKLRSPRTSRPKKRRRTSSKKKETEEEANVDVHVTLSQLDLLNLSSAEYEDLVKNITSTRELSSNERIQLTRQRRLIKNRESAQASRQRKKSYIQHLERKVNELVNQNAQLKRTVETLTNDKINLEALFAQQAMAGNQKKKEGITTTDVLNFQLLSNTNSSAPVPSIKTSAIVMLIIIFSFGLLFHHVVSSQKLAPVLQKSELDPKIDPKKDPLYTSKILPRAPTQAPLRALAHPHAIEHVRKHAHARVVASDEEETLDEDNGLKLNNKTKNKTKRVLQHEKDKKSQDHVGLVKAHSPKTRSSTAPATRNTKPTDVTYQKSSPKSLSELSEIIRPEISEWKPNTTYLLCTNVLQIVPPATVVSEDPDVPLMMSFLIPPDRFCGNFSSDQKNDAGERSILQVMCEIVDVSNIPLKTNNLFFV